MTKSQRKKIREQGRKDFLAGKPITAFDELGITKNVLALQSLYEMGWREEKEEQRKERKRAAESTADKS